MTNTYYHDNRYSPGSSGGVLPLGVPAAYAARWIDHSTWAEILPDRQGFAYNDAADRDRLIAFLTERGVARKMPNVAYEITKLVIDDPEWVLVMRRSGGYVYVDAWLVPEASLLPDMSDDVEVEGHVTNVPLTWPVQPLAAGAPMTDTVATCGTCGRSWDDAIVTSMTPAPSARCPFEVFHPEVEVPVYVDQDGDVVEVDPLEMVDWQYAVANGDTLLGFAEWVRVHASDDTEVEVDPGPVFPVGHPRFGQWR